MSQIQSFGFGSGPLPPTGVGTLTGDIGGPITPTANNINILGKDTLPAYALIEVDGTLVGSTLSIKPLLDNLTTAGAVPTVFPNAVFSLTPNSSLVFSAYVIGNVADYSASCGGFVTCVARRQGIAAPVIVGQSPLLSRDSTTGLPIFGILLDGNSIKVGVQGVAAEIWNWTCSYQWVVRT